MKKDIHPEYRPVVFWDTASGSKFMIRSAIKTRDTIEWEDGQDYPLVKIEVSSISHPFYTGEKIFVDTEGRIERFNRKYQRKDKK